jgi:tetratricopeptide (TPR) repeat protein
LALNLSAEEQEEMARGQSANIEAREAFQNGWEHYFRFTPKDNAKAAEQFKRAVELDAEYGRAYSALGMVYVRGCQWRWQEELGMSTGEANYKAQQYLAEGEKRASSLTNVAASHIHLYNGRHDKAFTEAARAVALDPNDPEAHVAMGLAMITTGRPEAGLEFVETALRLNPRPTIHYVLAHAMAYFSMDDLEKAAAVLKEALDRDPSAVEPALFLAASYARLGRREEARAALLHYRPGASQFELQNIGFAFHFPYEWSPDNHTVQRRIRDGMFIAGLPLDVTIESLMQSLQQEDGHMRKRAALTLGRFGPKAVEAVPALIDALADEEYVVREKAAEALGKIGPAAEAAIPALTALEDAPYVGYQAKKALKKIAGE